MQDAVLTDDEPTRCGNEGVPRALGPLLCLGVIGIYGLRSLKANVHQDVSEGYGGNSLASVSDREKRVSTVFRGNLLHYQYIPVL